MNKQAFLYELQHKLKRLPAEEVDNAITYYEEYLSDAGQQNEANAIEALGSPSFVAAKIIGEYAINDANSVDFVYEKEKRGKNRSRLSPLTISIIAVCASPVAIPVVVSVLAIVVATAICVLALGVSAASVATAGIACVLVSLWLITTSFSTALLYFGVGIFAFALGIASTASVVKLSKLIVKGLQKWIGGILIKNRSMYGRREK